MIEASTGFEQNRAHLLDSIEAGEVSRIVGALSVAAQNDNFSDGLVLLEEKSLRQKGQAYPDLIHEKLGLRQKEFRIAEQFLTQTPWTYEVRTENERETFYRVRQAPISYMGRLFLLVDERVLSSGDSNIARDKKFTLRLEPFSDTPEGEPDILDYERTWLKVVGLFEEGTTTYDASMPVIPELGNRPSLKYYDSETTDELPKMEIDLSLTIGKHGDPIRVAISPKRDDERMGYPLSKEHNFGSPPRSGDESEFSAIEAIMYPNRSPIIIGHRHDGSTVVMEEGECKEKMGISGVSDFFIPIFLRLPGKLRHTKVGRYVGPKNHTREIPPLSSEGTEGINSAK